MAKIGYARVSTKDQHVDNQVERLKADGCERVFVDHGASGARASRPEWDKCLEYLRRGDELVAVKIDRFGRSIHHLMQLSEDFAGRGIQLRCLDQPIDTTTPAGRLFYGMLAVFAQFEREILIERTQDGLAATTARGRSGGRKPRLSAEQVAYARHLRAEHKSITQIREALANGGRPPSRATVYRALEMMGPASGPPPQREDHGDEQGEQDQGKDERRQAGA